MIEFIILGVFLLAFVAMYYVICNCFHRISQRLSRRGGKSYKKWEFYVPIYNMVLLLEMGGFPRAYMLFFFFGGVLYGFCGKGLDSGDTLTQFVSAIGILALGLLTLLIQYKCSMRIAAKLGENLKTVRIYTLTWLLCGVFSESLIILLPVSFLFWGMLLNTLSKEKDPAYA